MPMSHSSEAVKWFKEKWGGTKKGKPHSTREGRIAAGERALGRNAEYWDKKREEEKKKRRAGPQAPSRPRPKAGPPAGMPKPKGERKMIPDKEEPGMYVKKGGKVDKKWIQKAVDPKHKGYCTPMTKPTCTPARKRLAKLFKSKAKKGWANGGTVVMPTVGKDSFMRTYKHGAVISPRPRPTVPHGSRMRGTGIAKRGW